MVQRTRPILAASTTDLAYWAGIIDGEGHVGIKYSNRTARGINYYARFALRMSDRAFVLAFGEAFGLKVSDRTYTNAISTSALSVAEAGAGTAAEVVAILFPYLRLKRRQAEIVLQLEHERRLPGLRTRCTGTHTYRTKTGRIATRRSFATGQEHLDRWHGYFLEVKALNKPTRKPEDPDED